MFQPWKSSERIELVKPAESQVHFAHNKDLKFNDETSNKRDFPHYNIVQKVEPVLPHPDNVQLANNKTTNYTTTSVNK